MTLRAAKWTAMLTRATQTLDRGYVSMDLPPTQLRGLWALTQSRARARASRSCAQDGFVPKPSRNTFDVQILPSRREVAYPVYFTIITPGRMKKAVLSGESARLTREQ